jgi:sterol desaturase/sphingolipid hydroxylase (fatty acid hydroxylase superfamily)
MQTNESVAEHSKHSVEHSSRSSTFKGVSSLLWSRDLSFDQSRHGWFIFFFVMMAALLSELLVHHGGRSFAHWSMPHSATVFYNVAEIPFSAIGSALAAALACAVVARGLFGLAVAVADLVFYRRLTGKPFPWNVMLNMAIVNLVFLTTAVFTFMNPVVQSILQQYVRLVASVPTLVHLNGAFALVLACLAGDLAFYWSHRWSHKLRFFWTLGHINHHRTRELCQLTHAVDPQSFLLDTAGGKVFVLLLLPFFVKLITFDMVDAGWAMLVAIVLDTWMDPSHSIVLYQAEIRWAPLRAMRWLLVTPAVHYTHHSREEIHNKSDGGNFGARFTIWDRLFGTYVEPPQRLPETGLFSETADYCGNPLRFLFLPYVHLVRELRANRLRHWPAILFGRASYQPPVVIASAH